MADIFVEVMYADRTRQRVKAEAANTLPKTGVLFMITSAVDAVSPRVRGVRRVDERQGYDHYYVIDGPTEAPDGVEVGGWDDLQRRVVNRSDPFAPVDISRKYPEKPWWVDDRAIVFEGVRISDAEWAAALDEFQRDMH